MANNEQKTSDIWITPDGVHIDGICVVSTENPGFTINLFIGGNPKLSKNTSEVQIKNGRIYLGDKCIAQTINTGKDINLFVNGSIQKITRDATNNNNNNNQGNQIQGINIINQSTSGIYSSQANTSKAHDNNDDDDDVQTEINHTNSSFFGFGYIGQLFGYDRKSNLQHQNNSSFGTASNITQVNNSRNISGQVLITQPTLVDVHVIGDVTNGINLESGNIAVYGSMVGNVNLTKGNVTSHNNIGGNVNTTNGSIYCQGNINGSCNAACGNIISRNGNVGSQ